MIVRLLLGGDRVHLAQHLDEPRARHDRVVEVVVGRDAGDRAERRLAALPQQRALGLVGRDPHGPRAVRPRRRASTAVHLRVDAAGQAVDLDEQHRRRVARDSPRRRSPRPRAVISASIISSAAGTIPAAMIPLTVAPASSIDVKSRSRVRTAGGSGVSRTAIRVAMPIVPSLPTKQPRRS